MLYVSRLLLIGRKNRKMVNSMEKATQYGKNSVKTIKKHFMHQKKRNSQVLEDLQTSLFDFISYK